MGFATETPAQDAQMAPGTPAENSLREKLLQKYTEEPVVANEGDSAPEAQPEPATEGETPVESAPEVSDTSPEGDETTVESAPELVVSETEATIAVAEPQAPSTEGEAVPESMDTEPAVADTVLGQKRSAEEAIVEATEESQRKKLRLMS